MKNAGIGLGADAKLCFPFSTFSISMPWLPQNKFLLELAYLCMGFIA
jgi:hypothetical protein